MALFESPTACLYNVAVLNLSYSPKERCCACSRARWRPPHTTVTRRGRATAVPLLFATPPLLPLTTRGAAVPSATAASNCRPSLARLVLELGSYIGKSTRFIAAHAPPTARVLTCDLWDNGFLEVRSRDDVAPKDRPS